MGTNPKFPAPLPTPKLGKSLTFSETSEMSSYYFWGKHYLGHKQEEQIWIYVNVLVRLPCPLDFKHEKAKNKLELKLKCQHP